MMRTRAEWTSRLLSFLRIVVGFMFMQHGTEKLWAFPSGRVDHNFMTLRGMAGPIEVIGGLLMILGLFTRPTAFILCGEMAVAYFNTWAPRGFWPINNGGEGSVVYCFAFLWLTTAGAGAWSLDHLRREGRQMAVIASWESETRSILRIVLSFVFSLHGYRALFGFFPAPARARIARLALDALPPAVGYFEIAAGALLLLGLFTEPVALLVAIEAVAAYLYAAAPKGFWTLRNGGEEAMIYFLVFLYIASTGPGPWSLDRLRQIRKRPQGTPVSP